MHITHTHTRALGVPPHQSGTKRDKTYHVSSQWEQTLLTHCSLEALSLGPTTAMHCLTRASEQGCADSHTSMDGCKHHTKTDGHKNIYTYRYIDIFFSTSLTPLRLCGLLFNPHINHNTLKSMKACTFCRSVFFNRATQYYFICPLDSSLRRPVCFLGTDITPVTRFCKPLVLKGSVFSP